ncbi:MAG: aspartate aminotransferase family protein [Pseudomonadota bacterium]
MTPHSTALFQTYARSDLAFERGEGSWLIATDGRRFLDFAAGIAVNVVGHSHPHVVEALKHQADKLWHVSNLYRIPEQERLGARLTDVTFADRVFFGNSGAEAIELAIKLARRYQWANGAPERYRIITFEGAFHGRTIAAVNAGGQAKYLEGFGPRLEGFDQVPFGDLAALEAAIGQETAAILVEPVQGEGGIRPLPIEHLKAMRGLCDKHGLLLMFDEIQCGFGRTGHLFAHQAARVTPDVMAVAKALGAGFPVGACLATEAASAPMSLGTHGSTYGGNPLAMAVSNAVLDVVLADGFLDHVRRVSGRFVQGLSSLVARYPELFHDARGTGLILGLGCVVPNTDVLAAVRDEGLLAVGAGQNVLRLLPPLTVSEDEIDEALARLEAAAMALSGSDQPKAAGVGS